MIRDRCRHELGGSGHRDFKRFIGALATPGCVAIAGDQGRTNSILLRGRLRDQRRRRHLGGRGRGWRWHRFGKEATEGQSRIEWSARHSLL